LVQKKNIFRFIISLVLLACLLQAPVAANAQYDTVAAAIADSLPGYVVPDEEVEEAVVEPLPDVAVEETDEYRTEYFAEKWQYADDTLVQQRNIPGNRIKEMKEESDFWYANTETEKEKQPEVKSGSSDPVYVPLGRRNWFQSLLWVIIIAVFVAAIMWYLMSSNVGLFSKKDVAVAGAESEELSLEDIFAINYQKELQKAEEAGNYRLAIRLMFLRALKIMSEKNIIRYQQDKTNFDYLVQLHSTKHYDNFFRVTRDYEYSWYGQFDVPEEAYRLVKNDFNRFNSQLG